jgi:hypothetical protein
VRINEDADEQQVVMDVTAKFIGEKCKKEAKVCLHRTAESSVVQLDVSVVIVRYFKHEPSHPLHQVFSEKDSSGKKGWSPVLFDIVLRLPRRRMHVQNLTTHLSFFEHTFEDLNDWYAFDTFSAQGNFSPFGAKVLLLVFLS